MNLKAGDIVKYDESPCEILCAFPKLDYVFLINKRTLCADFVHPSEVEFVRRPTQPERNRK